MNQISSAQVELQEYMSSPDYNRVIDPNLRTPEAIQIAFEKHRALADAYFSCGDLENAHHAMRMSFYLFLELAIPDNYNIFEEVYDTLIDEAGEWMSSHRMNDEIIPLYEAVFEHSLTTLFHHYDNSGIRRLYYELIDIYEDNGWSEKLLRLEERTFRIQYYRHIMNASWDAGSYFHPDLSCIRQYYKDLLKTYTKSGEVERAVVLIEQWLELCDLYYIDCEDEGWAFDDYDDAVNYIAWLWDGSDRLVNILKESKSRFLDAPAILVMDPRSELYGFVDSNNDTILPCTYSSAWKATSSNFFSVKLKQGGWTYVSSNGNRLINQPLDFAYPPQEGKLLIGEGGNVAIVDIEHNSISPIQFNIASFGFFHDNLLKVCIKLSQPKNDALYDEESSDASLYSMAPMTGWNFVLPHGDRLLLPESTERVYSPNRGIIIAGRYDEDGDFSPALYNLSGKVIVPEGEFQAILPFGKQELTPYRKDWMCGYINRVGEVIVPAKYTAARTFSDELAAVRNETGLWGFIDTSGYPCQFREVGDFREGFAWVCPAFSMYDSSNQLSKIGYLRKGKDSIVSELYDDATSFIHGLAFVRKNTKWFRIEANDIN